jgi:hypothetical protein
MTPTKNLEQFLADLPEPEPSAPEGPAAEAEEATESPKDETDSSPESTDTTAPSPKAAAKTPSPGAPSMDLDPGALRAALASGDLETVADILGEDPASFKEGTRKWAAKQRVAAEQQRENARVSKQAETVVTRWKPVADLTQAVDGGDYSKVPELIRALGIREDWDSLVMKAVRAKHGTDPQAEVLKRRVAELEAQVPKVDERATAEQAFHEIIRDEVDTKHKVRDIEDWEAKVGAVLKESLDPDLGEPKLSAKQAADRVLRREREAFEKRRKVFEETAQKKVRATSALERPALASGAKVGKVSREDFFAQVAKRPL